MLDRSRKQQNSREQRSEPAARRARPNRRAGARESSAQTQPASNHRLQRQLREQGIQAKLTVNEPDDEYEKEAERVADAVMQMSVPTIAVPSQAGDEEQQIQRMCSRCQRRYREGKSLNCEECEEELQRQENSRESPMLDAETQQQIQSLRGGGRPLPESVRSFFEPRFGREFSDVRIHTGHLADEAARSVHAEAFTRGQDIVFQSGAYQPRAKEGKRLLAHELTHVKQQQSESSVARQSSSTQPRFRDCTPSITSINNANSRIESARRFAISMSRSAITWLQAAITHRSGPGAVPEKVQDALATHFHNPNRQQLGSAIQTFKGAINALNRTNRIICNSESASNCDPNIGDDDAYAWCPGGPNIHLCPSVFDNPRITLPLTLIHEAAHVDGACRDCYINDNCYANLNASKAVENAESYAFFARAVHPKPSVTRPSPPRPESPNLIHDIVEEGPRVRERLLESAEEIGPLQRFPDGYSGNLDDSNRLRNGKHCLTDAQSDAELNQEPEIEAFRIGASQNRTGDTNESSGPQNQEGVTSDRGTAVAIQQRSSSGGREIQVHDPYFVHFSHAPPPRSPNHSDSSPGPSGGRSDRAGYTHVRNEPRMTVAWDSGSPSTVSGTTLIPLYVRSANIYFRLEPVEIFVSADYPVGSCPYRVTLSHEYEHARAFIRIFRQHRETLVRRVNEIPLPTEDAPRLVPASQVQTMQDRIMAPVAEAIRDVRAIIGKEMRKDRNKRDAPSAYRRVYRQCRPEQWQQSSSDDQ